MLNRLSTVPSRKTPARPTLSSSSPPSAGPSIRVALPVADSSAIAEPSRSMPAISPLMMRRIGRSAAKYTPLRKAPSAMCQSSIAPLSASMESTTEDSSRTTRPASSSVRRS